MEIGASSACFYPVETVKAFLNIAKLGFGHSEIFFNSPCELEKPFLKELKAISKAYSTSVTSLHPYTSAAEGYILFSGYERRFHDGIELYKSYFDAAATLGAEYIVLHGAKLLKEITAEEYAERFAILDETAKGFGCRVAHENVVNFVGQTPEFMKFMKKHIGDDFKMVLDIKQARRTGVDPIKFIEEMGSSIVHVHLSDYNKSCDCIPPSEKGLYDFKSLFTALDSIGYDGKCMIELYLSGFSSETEITESAKYLEDILNKIKHN